MNRTVQDKITCALKISVIKSKKLWLFALSDVLMKLNVLPRRHLQWQTPFYLWYGYNYNFSRCPLLPFGCRIMAHIPASMQTKLSDNSTLHYYVGSAPFHKGGIMLFNPKTKQTILRRSFHQINPTDADIPTLPLSVPTNDDPQDPSLDPTPPDPVPSIVSPVVPITSPAKHNYLLRSRVKLSSPLTAFTSDNHYPTFTTNLAENIIPTSAGTSTTLPITRNFQSVPFRRISGSTTSSHLQILTNTHLNKASIFCHDSVMSFSFYLLLFVIFVPNIFIVVFGDISTNPSSFRSILVLFSSKYLQQCFLIFLLQSSRPISIPASAMTTNHDISSIPATIPNNSTSTSNDLPTIPYNLSVSTAFSAQVPITPYIPRSISAISKSPHPEKWTLALSEEIKSLISQNVFDTSPHDISTIPASQIVPSQVIFDLRYNADGSINKYKARLVAQGNHQDSSTFFETFADAASHKSINVLLSLAASESLLLSSVDIKTAFLYSPIKKTLYLRRPHGLDPTIMPSIVKLNKCIYGLRQAAFEWRLLLDTTLKKIGFIQLQTDKCIYSIHRSHATVSETLILGVYVDDILCLGSTMSITTWFHQQLSNYFTITINLKISSFLGMQIDHDVPNKIITISQPGYIKTILQRFNITKEVSKHALHIPFSQYDLTDDNPSTLSKQDQSLYMQIIGSLLFLSTRSRPDISFHVNYLSLYMKSATQHQLKLAKRILAYIFHTQDIHLHFHGQEGLNFFAYVDSSYASHSDRKSQFGISIHINNSSGSCISISKKAKLLALSSTEAEYLALFEASKTIMWLRQFLTELGYPPSTPTIIYEDNKSAINIIHNGNDKGRTKHMDIRYHYIRELVQDLFTY